MIDFQNFRNSGNESEKKATAREVVAAFKEVGFVYLRNYGISEDTVQNAFMKVCLVFEHAASMMLIYCVF